MRIATFNVQNMRLRRIEGQGRLDGAVDRDYPAGAASPRLDVIDRRLTAEVIRAVGADVVALQEVFDAETLDFFHDRFLRPAGGPDYPHRICLPGNDGHGLNVAALSRLRPVAQRSHAAETGADFGLDDLPSDLRDRRLFRRDCLMLRLEAVTLFICHFKAPWPDRARARVVREAEARAVRRIVERSFDDPEDARWIVLGDLNEPRGSRGLAALRDGFAIDLMGRIPQGADWTFAMPDTHARSRPDGMMISPALDREFPGLVPRIFRAGMDPQAAQRAGGPFRAVGDPRPHASDHAAVYLDLPGL